MNIRSSQARLALSAALAFGAVFGMPAAGQSLSTVAASEAPEQAIVQTQTNDPMAAITTQLNNNLNSNNTKNNNTKPSKYAYKTYVANAGTQAQVNACTGGVTNMTAVTDYLTKVEGKTKTYYPIHNECGGRPILSLKVGQTVLIDNVGKYKVVDTRDVARGAKASELVGMPGSALIQTCHDSGPMMRVVALAKI